MYNRLMLLVVELFIQVVKSQIKSKVFSYLAGCSGCCEHN